MEDFFKNREIALDDVTGIICKNDTYEFVRHLINFKHKFSFLLVDVDNFKFVSDTYGYDNGSKILRMIAQVLKEKIGEKGIAGRIEGDKFLLVLKDIVLYEDIWSFCHELLVNLNEVQFPDFPELSLTYTMGVARFPENGTNFEAIAEATEKCLYRGKTKGRNCFIIYIPEKHANIVIKSHEEKGLSSSTLHSTIFKFLSTDDLKSGITNLFNFLSSYFKLDHICIQSEGNISFQKIHQTAKFKNFEYVPDNLIGNDINTNTGMFCINDVNTLLQNKHMELFESLERQSITSTSYFDINFQDKSYGYLRIDMTGKGKDVRIWQYSDLDIFLTAAKTIAIILHHTKSNLAAL